MHRNTVERNRERTARVMERLFGREDKRTGISLRICEVLLFASILITSYSVITG